MNNHPFTLATYRVKSGKEDDFVKRWKRLADTFSAFENPPFWGLLIRSRTVSGLYHSFGPWEKLEHVEAMRSSPESAAAFQGIREVCDDVSPDDYEVVLHVRVREGGEV